MGKRGPKPGAENAGRPAKPIDIRQVEKLAMLDCADWEMAAFFGMSLETFNKKKNENQEILDAVANGKGLGCRSIRRRMYKQAMEGDKTMLIWLSKNRLGYTDKQRVELGGEVTVKAVRAEDLSDDQLAAIATGQVKGLKLIDRGENANQETKEAQEAEAISLQRRRG